MFLRMPTIGKTYCIVEGEKRVLSWDENHPFLERFGTIQSRLLYKQFVHSIIMFGGIFKRLNVL